MIDRGHGTLIAVMALVALFYMALLPVVFRHLNPVTGDEPFYIMTAQSMLLDRDLDETNNYANRDYEAFYPDDPLPANWQGWPAFPRTLPPHPATTERPGLYTKHALGLSLLIAAPYKFAGRLGAVLVVMLFAVLLAGQMFMLAREAGATGEVAALVALGLAIAMPIAPYATLIFPEIPAALLIVYAVRRLSAKTTIIGSGSQLAPPSGSCPGFTSDSPLFRWYLLLRFFLSSGASAPSRLHRRSFLSRPGGSACLHTTSGCMDNSPRMSRTMPDSVG
jgi:hypothetical protein